MPRSRCCLSKERILHTVRPNITAFTASETAIGRSHQNPFEAKPTKEQKYCIQKGGKCKHCKQINSALCKQSSMYYVLIEGVKIDSLCIEEGYSFDS